MKMTTIIYLQDFNDSFLTAIDSLERQKAQPDEILILDQNQGNFLGGFLDQKNNLKYFNFWGVSLYEGINQLIECASGDCVTFLKACDYWFDDRLRECHELFKSHPDCQWMVSNSIVTDKYLRPLQGLQGFAKIFPLFELTGISPSELFEINQDEELRAGYFTHSMNFGSWVELSGFAIRKKVFQDMGGFQVSSQLSTECDFYTNLILSYPGIVSMRPAYYHRNQLVTSSRDITL